MSGSSAVVSLVGANPIFTTTPFTINAIMSGKVLQRIYPDTPAPESAHTPDRSRPLSMPPILELFLFLMLAF